MLDAELVQGPADLGLRPLVDRLARLRGHEVVAAAVGVEGQEQPPPGDRLAHALKAAHRPFLVHQKGRVNLAGGVVHGHDQVELPIEGRDPAVARAVLVQQHPRKRAPRALLAVRPPARRLLDQAGLLEPHLGPRVAQAEPVIADQVLVEVLHREPLVALAVKPQHPIHFVHRHPLGRGLAEPAVQEPVEPLLPVAVPPAPERALAHPQQVRRVGLAQSALLPALQNALERHHPEFL